MRVLIIDDSRANRMVLQKFMKEFGFETAEAENGLDAIWMLKRSVDVIDVITVDYNMPKMTGVQFVRLVREKPELDRIQIIMITSETSQERQTEAIEAGVNAFLPKPFDKDMVEEALEALGVHPKKSKPEAPAGGPAPARTPEEELAEYLRQNPESGASV